MNSEAACPPERRPLHIGQTWGYFTSHAKAVRIVTQYEPASATLNPVDINCLECRSLSLARVSPGRSPSCCQNSLRYPRWSAVAVSLALPESLLHLLNQVSDSRIFGVPQLSWMWSTYPEKFDLVECESLFECR